MVRRRGKKRPAQLNGRVFYIRRKSVRDDTLYFCADDGEPVFFEKVTWATFLLSSFKPDQKAHIVCRSKEPGDVDYREFLPTILPETLPAEEYLAAVEQTMRDRRAGRQPSARSVRAFEREVGWR